MRISRQRAGLRPALAAFMGLVLTGVVAAPAQAETAREQQWHLDLMRADEMWKTSTGKGVTIAVIDTGVDEGATNLRGQVLDGVDYSSEKGDEHTDWGEHGTVMAALIAGTGAGGERAGAYGLAPGSKILPIRMPKEGEGVTGLLVTPSYLKKWAKRMAQAIRFAADSEAKVINISMASPGAENPELSAAVKYALDKGKLIFAGVGNSGDVKNELQYPAATPGVTGVAGVDRNAKPYKSSQWGAQVDLAAPAVDIVSTCPNDRQVCKASGTSNASALASASAALLWSQHPDWTNYQVLRVLLQTASGNDKGLSRDDVVGYGVVRPRIALTEPGDPGLLMSIRCLIWAARLPNPRLRRLLSLRRVPPSPLPLPLRLVRAMRVAVCRLWGSPSASVRPFWSVGPLRCGLFVGVVVIRLPRGSLLRRRTAGSRPIRRPLCRRRTRATLTPPTTTATTGGHEPPTAEARGGARAQDGRSAPGADASSSATVPDMTVRIWRVRCSVGQSHQATASRRAMSASS